MLFRLGDYSTLFTELEGNNCFSIITLVITLMKAVNELLYKSLGNIYKGHCHFPSVPSLLYSHVCEYRKL